jgi:predicted ATP-dependent serine protease
VATQGWRCSQCGAVNEPQATSCRSCGKWASLFDLEEEGEGFAAQVAPGEAVVAEPEPVELEPFELEPFEPFEPASDSAEPGRARRGRVLRSLLLPLALVIYLVVSLLSER